MDSGAASSAPLAAEIIAGAGFDWIVIDGEHAPNDIPSLLAQLHAMRGGIAEPVFRGPWKDGWECPYQGIRRKLWRP